jgi:hypothetical protein
MAYELAGTSPPFEHELEFRPDYKFFSIRDGSSYNVPGAAEALAAARANVAAANALEMFVVCAQELVRVHVAVHQPSGDQWRQRLTGWQGPLEFRLSFPTGEVGVGDDTGQAVEVRLSSGPGTYVVSLFHRGREEAVAQVAALPQDEFVHGTNTAEILAPLHAVERYYLVFTPEKT